MNYRALINSNFCLIRSETLLTNDFELTVPDLYKEYLHALRPYFTELIYRKLFCSQFIVVLKVCNASHPKKMAISGEPLTCRTQRKIAELPSLALCCVTPKGFCILEISTVIFCSGHAFLHEIRRIIVVAFSEKAKKEYV